MSALLDRPPYGPRDDATLLAELEALTRHHLAGCPPYARLVGDLGAPTAVAELPFVHVGLFKHVDLLTEAEGLSHGRTLLSSATTSGVSSRIVLDDQSAALQARSVVAILADFVGADLCPLIVLDSPASLRSRGQLSARVAAALSLRPLASELKFVLRDAADPGSMDWDAVAAVLDAHPQVRVYGFTWVLWQAWAAADLPSAVRALLASRRVHFVHSGGWKKLEEAQVDAARFEADLLTPTGPGSAVVDFYGLVEQAGVVYPACSEGLRHVPVWADVVVRDPYSMEPLDSTPGQLQLLNLLARGAPYHSVLTEDLVRLVPGSCVCGRQGKRFELLGRMPRAELRGCANV